MSVFIKVFDWGQSWSSSHIALSYYYTLDVAGYPKKTPGRNLTEDSLNQTKQLIKEESSIHQAVKKMGLLYFTLPKKLQKDKYTTPTLDKIQFSWMCTGFQCFCFISEDVLLYILYNLYIKLKMTNSQTIHHLLT